MSKATAKQPTPHTPEESTPQARGGLRVRIEGAPWLSLRDRCGAPQRRASSRRQGWLSLSRLEVAMVVVLFALLAAVFQGVQHEPLLALTPPEEAPPFATVSLND